VRQGQIDLVWPALGGRSQTAVRLQAGEVFGEESLFDHDARPASARAVSDYQLIRLNASVFERLVNEDPKIPVQTIRLLLRRTSRLVDLLAKTGERPDASASTPRVSAVSGDEPPRLHESPGSRTKAGEPVFVDPATGRMFPIADEGELIVGRS